MSKIWNTRFMGLFGAAAVLSSVIIKRIADRVTTLIVSHNLKYCGAGVRIHRCITYRYPNRISVGNNAIIGAHVILNSEHLSDGASDDFLLIGNSVSIGDHSDIDFTGGVQIDERAHLAHDVQIITHNHGYDYASIPVGRPLHIGGNAFIGSHSRILPGCTYIGKNTIVGLGSIVTKDIPDNAIVAGIPAKLIKYRTE